MQIATGIISLILSFVVLFQSCAVSVTGSMAGNESAAQGGSVGILVGVLFICGGAFSFKLPRISMYLFIAAGVLALIAGNTVFSDMTGWAVISGIFAYMSYRSQKKKVDG